MDDSEGASSGQLLARFRRCALSPRRRRRSSASVSSASRSNGNIASSPACRFTPRCGATRWILHPSERHGDTTPGSTILVPLEGIDARAAELNGKRYPHARPGVERHD
ncbi:putative glyoxalase/bleomycin resistance protein/dioxygenase [Burkholderia thailandensis]|uniref:Glyoxalase/bleomycin resistance protein/dioxygenase n=1 Tax=Burkholderia thailandensis TaxID=57975 RepID=A0AAW9D2N0_BURTH|nr:putative glyoxalase/bleomycin resistance protein/dioxygenase [Burkholderia thailandensis]MDW9255662.1 putative glyoxalase/bleomycin resistance protein/dioxygenase [Burkholderia thailandensis]